MIKLIRYIQLFGFVVICLFTPVFYAGQIIGDMSTAALDYLYNAGKAMFNEPDNTSQRK